MSRMIIRQTTWRVQSFSISSSSLPLHFGLRCIDRNKYLKDRVKQSMVTREGRSNFFAVVPFSFHSISFIRSPHSTDVLAGGSSQRCQKKKLIYKFLLATQRNVANCAMGNMQMSLKPPRPESDCSFWIPCWDSLSHNIWNPVVESKSISLMTRFKSDDNNLWDRVAFPSRIQPPAVTFHRARKFRTKVAEQSDLCSGFLSSTTTAAATLHRLVVFNYDKSTYIVYVLPRIE